MEQDEVPYQTQEEFDAWLTKLQNELRAQLDKWYHDDYLPLHRSPHDTTFESRGTEAIR
jgi:hypothetical protein